MNIKNTEVNELLNKIESLDWSVELEGTNEYRLSKYSPAGQDFSFNVSGATKEEIIDSIYEAYNDFDVSYETYIWLDSTGHGTNGAPYELREVLEDVESCEEMIELLYRELK